MHGFLNSAINSLINHCNVRLGYVARLHTDDGHPKHTSSYVMMTWPPLLFMVIHAKVPIEWEIAKM